MKLGKRVSICLLSLLLITSMFTCVFAETYEYIDLSDTQNTYTINQTGNIVVKGVSTAGEKTTLTSGVTFENSNPSVLTLEADGGFTTLCEGTARVTARYGSLEKSIVILVYRAKSNEQNFDTEKTYAVKNAHDTSITYTGTYDFSTAQARSGKSLHLQNIPLGEDASKYWVQLDGAFTFNGSDETGKAVNAADYRGVMQFWFYDDMKESYKNFFVNFFGNEIAGVTTKPDGSLTAAIRGFFGPHLVANAYRFSPDGGQAAFELHDVPRSKGWHQFLLDYSQNDTYSMYVDGQLVATRTLEGWNGGLKSMAILRQLKPAERDQETYIDDFGVYNITPSQQVAPVASNVRITDGNMVGNVLRASYTYSDANGDAEDKAATQVNWYRADSADATNWEKIGSGAEYTITAADKTKYIRAGVVPVSAAEPKTGVEAFSNLAGPVMNLEIDTEIFTALDISKTKTLFAASENAVVQVKGSCENGVFDITASSRVSYASSDSYVATVAADGTITAKNPGVTRITAMVANSDGTQAVSQIMVGVHNGTVSKQDFENFNYNPAVDTHLATVTDPVRSGSKALRISKFPSGSSSTLGKWGGLDLYNGPVPMKPAGVSEGWFYDDGSDTSDAVLYFQSNQKDTDGSVIDITATYNVGLKASNSKTHYYLDSGAKSGREAANPDYIGTCGVTRILNGQNGTVEMKRSKGWHQVMLVTTGKTEDRYTDKGKVSIYLDGIEVFTENYVHPNIGCVRGTGLYDLPATSCYDDFAIYEYILGDRPPVVESVSLDGAAMVNSTLRVTAEIIDTNGDVLDTPLYQWQKSADQIDWTDISSATNETYTCTAGDVGNYIRVRVTPRSTIEPKIGEPAYVQTARAVVAEKEPPAVSGVSMTGTAKIGSQLTADYTYVKPENGGDEGDTQIIFETAVAEAGPYTPVQTSEQKTYSPTLADAGKYLRVRVVPVDVNGLSGTEGTSAAVLIDAVVEFFVATDGDDSNTGTVEAPFATIARARDAVASAGDSLPEGGVVVNIRGGVYQFTDTVSFTVANSGSEGKPVIYQAYEGEEVVFMGGKKLDVGKVQKVTDPQILNRVIDPLARQKLMQLDLAEQGITSIPEIADYGFGLNQNYRPLEVYFNGEALQKSRWPNDEPGTGFVRTGAASYAGDYKTQPFTVEYLDEEGHTDQWDISKIKDMYISGFIGNDWAGVTHKVKSIDLVNKTVTSVGGTSYPPTDKHRLYFWNLIEEIDMPGESYIDRENKILYFYPTGDVSTAEMSVSTLDKYMLNFNGANNITVKGITFETSRNTMINVTGGESINIEDCIFARGSSNAVTLDAKNSSVKGCHIYEMGKGGITVKGGDRKTLTPADNVIENNRIHSFNRVYNSSIPGIGVYGVHQILRNNAVYDAPHILIQMFGANDIEIEYNEIYNGVLEASDIGAIYWGRNPTELGMTIRYNYFHDIGNKYGGYGQQSVFWDDGASGPYMYGNVFYRGTRTADQGGGPDNCYAVKTNGGQYGLLKNNIFVDAPSAAYFQPWNEAYSGDKQGRWWLYVQDAYTNPQNIWKKMKTEVDFESETYVSHYKDTIWDYLTDDFSTDLYNKTQEYYKTNNTTELQKLVNANAPAKTNQFKSNVAVAVNQVLSRADIANVTESNTYQAASDKLASGKSMFVDYGRDFTLTDEGLAEVRKTIADFENVPFSQMGLKTQVGGNEPSVSEPKINGVPEEGNVVTASYAYSDPDNDPEGASRIVWYIADQANGTYTRILGKQGKDLLIDKSYAKRYIKYEVIPYDRHMLYGDPVWSEPVQVLQSSPIDKVALREALSQANTLLAGAVVGDDVGQYPQNAKDEFEAAVEKAQAVANSGDALQYEVDNATKELQNAIKKFTLSKITATDKLDAEITRQAVNSLLADTEHWTVPDGTADWQDGSLVLETSAGQNFALANYNAKKFKNCEFTFKMKLEKIDGLTGDTWAGIYLRQGTDDSKIWVKNSGYMVDIKSEIINIQKYAGSGGIYETIDNDAIEYGREYILTVGAYDLREENKAAIIVTVDGAEIYSTIMDESDLYGQEGFLGFSAGHGRLTISPVEADKTSLGAAVAEASAFLADAVAGNDYGQYPQQSLDALNAAKTAAEAIVAYGDAVQYDVDKATLAVAEALSATRASVGKTGTINANGSGELNYDVENADLTIASGITDYTLQTDPIRVVPGLTVRTVTPSGDIVLMIEKGTLLSGSGWDGQLQLPSYSTAPSGTVNGTVSMVVKMGGKNAYVTSDRVVRIVLPGQAGKTIAYKNSAGRFVEVKKSISEDSFTAANAALSDGGIVKYASGGDMVIYTSYLTELAAYTPPSNTPAPTYIPGPDNTTGGTTTTTTGTSILLGGKEPEAKFADITGHWAENDIKEMVRRGIVTGVTETTFEPDRAVTRAEFATLMSKALGLTSVLSAGFADVDKGAWYAPYVNAAANVGLIVGADGYFRPDDRITREEMAVILCKARAFMGLPEAKGAIENFTDRGQISEWAYAYVDVAASVGLIAGMPDGSFAPQEDTTRAQAASVIKRLLDD